MEETPEELKAGPSDQMPQQVSADKPKWYAVYTQYKREKLVQRLLSEKGVQCYLPLNTFERVYTRKVKRVTLPLISCYIFVKILRSETTSVMDTEYVVRFIRFNRQMHPIPEREIDILKAITGENIQVEAVQLQPEVGDEVEIRYGRLLGLKGKLVDNHNGRYVVIELEQMGFSMRMQIDPTFLLVTQKTSPAEKPADKPQRMLDRFH